MHRLVEWLKKEQNASEFAHLVFEPPAAGKRAPLPLEDAVFAVLRRRGCPATLLREADRLLHNPDGGRTVKSAAAHAGVTRRTLNRQWRDVVARRELHDLFRLIKLVHMARATGSAKNRAAFACVNMRTARKAALDLTNKSLADLLSEPLQLAEILDSWFSAA